MNTAVFYSTFVILLSCISLGFAADAKPPLQCYVCNGGTKGEGSGEKCGIGSEGLDPSFLINCTQASKALGGGEAGVEQAGGWSYCRKIITWVDFDVNNQTGGIQRVMRRCGFIKDLKGSTSSCVYRGGLGGRQRVCTCETPGCNSAPAITTSFFSVLSIFVPMFIITVFQQN